MLGIILSKAAQAQLHKWFRESTDLISVTTFKLQNAWIELPAWKIAEVIDRLEEWGSREQKKGTFCVRGFGEISAGETGLKFRTISRFFHERVTDDGRKVRAERTLIDRANKGKSNSEITKVREVLVKELKRRDIKYRSPIGTAGDYQRAMSVDGDPRPIHDIVIRDYDLDEKGTIRPFIQELLRREAIQAVAIESGKGAARMEAINEHERNLREKKRWIGWNETAKNWAFTFAAFFFIAAPISYYVLQPPAGVSTIQQPPAGVATVEQPPAKVATVQRPPVGVATALSCIVLSFISLLLELIGEQRNTN